MNNEKNCLQCGAVLTGRPDKRFCDGVCRSRYNNGRNRDVTAQIRNINLILRRNRRILESFAGEKVVKERLIEYGFNFNYVTRVHTTEKGATYKLCYDHAYLDSGEQFRVVKWNDNSKTDQRPF